MISQKLSIRKLVKKSKNTVRIQKQEQDNHILYVCVYVRARTNSPVSVCLTD